MTFCIKKIKAFGKLRAGSLGKLRAGIYGGENGILGIMSYE